MLFYQTIIIVIVSAMLDVYSLYYRGGKFTFLQTGNIIYLATNLINHNITEALLSLLCLVTFGIGLFFAEILSLSLRKKHKDKYVSLMFLFIILLLLIPNFFFSKTILFDLSIVATVCLNLTGGILMSQFRNYLVPFTATMMTNNYKLMVENVVKTIETKDKIFLKKSFIYLIIIITFFLGALGAIYLINVSAYVIPIIALLLIILLFILELYKIRRVVCLDETI